MNTVVVIVGGGGAGCAAAGDGWQLQERRLAAEQHPQRVVALQPVAWMLDQDRAKLKFICQPVDRLAEVEDAVGHVDGDDAAGVEVLLVDGEGLLSEQMQRDGVAAEGVQHQQVEALRTAGRPFTFE